jgi:hypothetical protein
VICLPWKRISGSICGLGTLFCSFGTELLFGSFPTPEGALTGRCLVNLRARDVFLSSNGLLNASWTLDVDTTIINIAYQWAGVAAFAAVASVPSVLGTVAGLA